MPTRRASILRFASAIPMWQIVSALFLAQLGTKWGLAAVAIGGVEIFVNLVFLRITSRNRYFVLLEATELGLCFCLCLGAFMVIALSAQLWAVSLASLGVFVLSGVAFDRWLRHLAQGSHLSNKVSFVQMQQMLTRAESQAKQSTDPRIALLAALPPILLGLIYVVVRILDSSVARSLIALLVGSAGSLFFFVPMRRGYRRIVEWEQQTGQTQLIQEFVTQKR